MRYGMGRENQSISQMRNEHSQEPKSALRHLDEEETESAARHAIVDAARRKHEPTHDKGTTSAKTFMRIVGLPAATFLVFIASGSGSGAARTALPILLGLSIATYFLPTVEAALRKHPSLTSIGLVNLFLGWTLVGWVAAIAWACAGSDKKPKAETINTGAPATIHTPPHEQVRTPSIADELQKLVALRDQGVLTDEELSRQKAKLLA